MHITQSQVPDDRGASNGNAVFDPIRVASNSPHPVAFDIPDLLRASVRCHQDNLIRLVLSCREAGVSEHDIETSVTALVDSYKQELVAAIRSMTSSTTSRGDD